MAYTSEIDKLERRHRENPEGRTFAPLADAYRKAGDVPRALEILRTGLQIHPEYLSASIVLGRCHLDLGDLSAAEGAFQRVLELDKENVIAIKALADITERQARFDEAEHWLNYLLSIDSSNEEARQQLHNLASARDQHAQLAGPLDQPADTAPVAAADAEEPEPEPVSPLAFREADTAEISPASAPPSSQALADLEPAFEDSRSAAPVSGEPSFDEAAVEEPWEEPAAPDTAPLAPLVDLPPEPEPEPLVMSDERDEPAMAGFELEEDPMEAPSLPGEHIDVGVERHEEIVLRPSSTSEFQVPSDAELLGGGRSSGGYTSSFEEDAPPPSEEAPPPSMEETPVPEAEAEPEPAMSEATAEPERVTAEDLWQAHPEDATTGEGQREEPPFPTPEPVEPAGTANLGEPLVTETIGDVYASQGHHAQALDVYRQLLQRSPNDQRLAEKIRDLENRKPARGPARGYAAAETGGKSVLSYFGDLLAARLPTSNGSTEPESDTAPAAEPSSTGFMEEAFRTDEEPVSGEPTRPASGPLSLSAIFGEDSSPVPPVVAGPETTEIKPQASHFDEFFGERPAQPGGTTRTRSVRLDSDQDDLEQFHKWLKGLKR